MSTAFLIQVSNKVTASVLAELTEALDRLGAEKDTQHPVVREIRSYQNKKDETFLYALWFSEEPDLRVVYHKNQLAQVSANFVLVLDKLSASMAKRPTLAIQMARFCLCDFVVRLGSIAGRILVQIEVPGTQILPATAAGGKHASCFIDQLITAENLPTSFADIKLVHLADIPQARRTMPLKSHDLVYKSLKTESLNLIRLLASNKII